MVGHKHGKNISLTVRDGGEEKYGRRERTKEVLCAGQKVVTNTPVSERKILVGPFQDFALKVNEEALTPCQEIRGVRNEVMLVVYLVWPLFCLEGCLSTMGFCPQRCFAIRLGLHSPIQ